jgi:hypothetical protein
MDEVLFGVIELVNYDQPLPETMLENSMFGTFSTSGAQSGAQ